MRLHNTQVLIRPLITEKNSLLREELNAYVFEVHREANKHQIKSAIEELFAVKVGNIRTAIQRGKNRRVGKYSGKRRNYKKAFVTLNDGGSIDFFEGV